MNTQTNSLIDTNLNVNCRILRIVDFDLKLLKTVQKSLLYERELQKPLQIAKFQYCKFSEDSSWFSIHWTPCNVLENWMKSLGKQGFIYTYFFFTKILKHDPVEYKIIKQKHSVNNHSIESYLTICHSAGLSSQVSITTKKNKLFKLENNQSTKQVSITMKKNKLFKLANN